MLKKGLACLSAGLLVLMVLSLHLTWAFATENSIDSEDSVSWTEDPNDPDTSNPDTSDPDVSNPDVSNPDVSNPDVSNPDISEPDVSTPDTSDPDVSVPEDTDPEDSVSWTEGADNPDTSDPDTSDPDVSNPDTSDPDTSDPDTSDPDTSDPDTSDPDTSDPEDSVSWEDALSMVGTQVAELSQGNYALRFGFDLRCAGVTSDHEYNTVIGDDATVTINGTAYPLLGFGTKVFLAGKMPLTVPAGKLYSVNDNGTVTYTVRIVGIDENNLTTDIYVQGYITYLDGDTEKTYQTNVCSDNYQNAYAAANPPSAE